MSKKKKEKHLNFGTLNVRGCQEEYQKKIIIEDMNKYKIQVLSITETHINKTDKEEYSHYNETGIKEDYLFYYTGQNHNHGVGLVVEKNLAPNFDNISDRICIATINLEQHNFNIISVYAPTLQVSEKCPKKRTNL